MGLSAPARLALRCGALRCDPLGRLGGDRGDVVEVGVVVHEGGAVVFGGGCGEQVHDAGGAVLAADGHQRLDFAGAHGDLVDAGELDQLGSDAGDALVFTRVARRVAHFKVDGDEGGQGAV